MNSFDFDYYRPDTLGEAFACYQKLVSEFNTALYYSGGSEIISMARTESIRFHAVIDLKGIPECNALAFEGDCLVIGSAQTLAGISEAGHFPLLCETVSRIADHTMQGKITIGGNLAGTIIYREASLPLMITNSQARIMTKDGMRQMPFPQVFDGRLKLREGEFLIQLLIDKKELNLPYIHVKKTRMDKIDYPLVSLTGNKKDGKIRAAASGLGDTPILLPSDLLNDAALPADERIKRIIARLYALIRGDILGSKEYRKFALHNILTQMYENLEKA